jgi:hypothetical protein
LKNDRNRVPSAVPRRLHRKQIFEDSDYAWQLLECEMRLEIAESTSGEDVARLLQMYMVPLGSLRREWRR